ncbi:cytochrome c oxidase subunit II [Caulobacter sp. KR2-114]|uniref:cytochrome c oxidase subunit II n=1 Tax=Caulobacter sp. KR2-114 TaxID=3400912 RepID=UPI003C02EBE4
MKSKFSGIGRLAAGVPAAVLGVAIAAQAWAEDKLGQPTDGAMDLQPSASAIRTEAMNFHNHILLPIITIITLFVLALLVIVVVRFNRRANPTPARWSHNTPIEIVWTIAPVLILMFIAIFSFRLLFDEHHMPHTADLTVKVTGRQWNWDYEYPDQKISAFTSTLMDESTAKSKGVPFQLATTAPMVVPVGKVVQVLVTGEDVIHSWSVPAVGVKIDAVPGRVNQTWFMANKTGTFYGQCSQLCGIDHAFMPIEVKVVSQADFDAWVASKAPKTAPAAAAPATPAAAAAAPAASAAPAAASPAAASPAASAAPAASPAKKS